MAVPQDLDWANVNNNITPELEYYQRTGLIKSDQVPVEYVNWYINQVARKIDLFKLSSRYDFLIGDQSYNDASDFVYSPSVNSEQQFLLTKSVTIPTTKFLDFNKAIIGTKNQNVKIIINDNTSNVHFDTNCIQERSMIVEFNHTTTLGSGIVIDGNNNLLNNIIVHNKSTGTITNAINITAGSSFNHIKAFVKNDGGGTITNNFIDSGSNNILQIRTL
jgi:hypothetical protein